MSRASSPARSISASASRPVSSLRSEPTVAAPVGSYASRGSTMPGSRPSAPGPRPSASSAMTESLFDVRQREGLDQLRDLAVQDALQLVQGEADAVVGHAVLGIVVRADLRRAVAGADLRLAHARA